LSITVTARSSPLRTTVLLILSTVMVLYVHSGTVLLYFTRNGSQVAQPEYCDTTGPNGK
jgi:hypothetical protein